MVVKDKQGDIAILRTVGAKPSQAFSRIFITQGTYHRRDRHVSRLGARPGSCSCRESGGRSSSFLEADLRHKVPGIGRLLHQRPAIGSCRRGRCRDESRVIALLLALVCHPVSRLDGGARTLRRRRRCVMNESIGIGAVREGSEPGAVTDADRPVLEGSKLFRRFAEEGKARARPILSGIDMDVRSCGGARLRSSALQAREKRPCCRFSAGSTNRTRAACSSAVERMQPMAKHE